MPQNLDFVLASSTRGTVSIPLVSVVYVNRKKEVDISSTSTCIILGEIISIFFSIVILLGAFEMMAHKFLPFLYVLVEQLSYKETLILVDI